MMIGGDPEDLRRLAASVRRVAEGLADDTDRAASARHVEWAGVAATAFREELRTRQLEGTEISAAIHDVAREIDRLAETLQQRQSALLVALETAGRSVEDAQQWIADGVTDLVDTAEGLAREALDTIGDGAEALEDAARRGLRTIGLG
ncbi:hypothetical protein D9V41_06985 [Aeromicrobium phragmitis]|uniref:Uncharacterized protein n=1 Tax=Aeromicrobium phragmitis TaxID=2478914 RepID=A0A3L8PP17_9ACTN|nr:hypothetical protein [Aeromicrobium phragmitis]RLV56178.1 hypothetical protein D9V41_06985 [Aeromicrobium phragmitis]